MGTADRVGDARAVAAHSSRSACSSRRVQGKGGTCAHASEQQKSELWTRGARVPSVRVRRQAQSHNQHSSALRAACWDANTLNLVKLDPKEKGCRVHMQNKGSQGWWVTDLICRFGMGNHETQWSKGTHDRGHDCAIAVCAGNATRSKEMLTSSHQRATPCLFSSKGQLPNPRFC